MKQTKTTTVYASCPECQGTGRKDLVGWVSSAQLCCYLCGGSGRLIKEVVVEETVIEE